MLTIKGQLIAVLLLCFCLNLFSQNAETKVHFRLLGSDPKVESTFVVDAINNFGLLDAYRYEKGRRIIPIDNTGYSVELFSITELKKGDSIQSRDAMQHAVTSNKILSFSISPKGKLKPISN